LKFPVQSDALMSIHSSISGSTALSWALCLYQFRNLFYTVGRILWRVISPSQGPYLHLGQHKQNKRTHSHPCL
jgi:hypothetical protein